MASRVASICKNDAGETIWKSLRKGTLKCQQGAFNFAVLKAVSDLHHVVLQPEKPPVDVVFAVFTSAGEACEQCVGEACAG